MIKRMKAMRYKIPFDLYKKIKKMSQNEFSKWCERFAENMYNKGYNANNTFDPEENTILVFSSADELYNYLIKIKGMGPALTERVVQALVNISETNTNDQEPF